MDNIVIIGSSGHAKVVIDIVRREGKFHIVGLLDRFRTVGEQTLGYPILGREEDLPHLSEVHALTGVVVAIGDNFIRSKVATLIKALCPHLAFVTVVHPNACVGMDVQLVEGTVVMAGAVVNPGVSIGRFCILNTNSSLDHDCVLGDFASLAPGATTGGNCHIGPYCAISIRAALVHGVHIGEHTVIGAGSVVTRSVDSFVVAYGIPAKVVRMRNPGDKYL